MNSIQTFALVAATGLVLTFSASHSVASERSARIVAAPAIVADALSRGQAPVTTAPIVAPVGGSIRTASVIIVTPTPLPPRPPNFCNRGNSSGVSRCRI